jgi:hypothetical protein
MPASFEKCVSDLKKQGKSNDTAYAMSTSSYIESHGKSPFKSESDIVALPIQEQTKQTIKNMIEAVASGKKLKLTTEQTSQVD